MDPVGPGRRTRRIRELMVQGMRPIDIAKTLGIGRSNVYRAL
jgi:hypothetical protein